MLDYQKGDIVIECDGCADAIETGTSNFDSSISMLRRLGWQSRKEDGEWNHYCPRCQNYIARGRT